MANKQKKRKIQDVSVTVKLPLELRNAAREKSEKTGIALSFVVRKAIEDWVNENDRNRS